jgi:hypothetical protein
VVRERRQEEGEEDRQDQRQREDQGGQLRFRRPKSAFCDPAPASQNPSTTKGCDAIAGMALVSRIDSYHRVPAATVRAVDAVVDAFAHGDGGGGDGEGAGMWASFRACWRKHGE